jgi:pimeloyl-ACP methyl ester carboxylesterase
VSHSLPRSHVRLLPLGIGLAAAGVGAAIGMAAERVAVGRPLLPLRTGGDGHGDAEPFGSLRGAPVEVVMADGTRLHVEVDEASGTPALGYDGEPVTVVFSHGYALTSDSWHYQRLALRGRYRLVFWDQRGHGRSGSGPDGSATIDQIGRDLQAVLDAVAPSGPLVLVGHSMGGMTIMSLAQDRPDLFAERVVGVCLVATSAGGLGEVDFGLPRIGKMVQRVAPAAFKIASRSTNVIERGRRLGSDLETVLVRRYSFASPVSQNLVEFCAEMIASTRVEVISQFFPTFGEHDKRDALATLHGLEVLVLVGDSDLMTPVSHSDEIVHRVPGAEHVVVRDAGHLVMLEHPDVVTGHVADLIQRSLRAAQHPTKPKRRPLARRTVTPVRGPRGAA